MSCNSKSKVKTKNHSWSHNHHHCGSNINLIHDDGSRLNIPIWVLIVALNIGLWWWQPLLLVLMGAIIAIWAFGYRIEREKEKNDFI